MKFKFFDIERVFESEHPGWFALFLTPIVIFLILIGSYVGFTFLLLVIAVGAIAILAGSGFFFVVDKKDD